MKYFIDKLEPMLEELLCHELRQGSGDSIYDRAKTLFMRNAQAEDLDYSAKFIQMLQESYKYWGTTMDESQPAAGKLVERFYELLDKGAIEFTDTYEYYQHDGAKLDIFSENAGNNGTQNSNRSGPPASQKQPIQKNQEDQTGGIIFHGKTDDKPLPNQEKLEEYFNSLLSMRAFCVEMINNNDEIDESKNFTFFSSIFNLIQCFMLYRVNTSQFTEIACISPKL